MRSGNASRIIFLYLVLEYLGTAALTRIPLSKQLSAIPPPQPDPEAQPQPQSRGNPYVRGFPNMTIHERSSSKANSALDA